MKYKIINAPVLMYPYPHTSIQNIFPQKFYKQILKLIPKIDQYTHKPKYPGRSTYALENLNELDEKKKKFWNQIFEWLKSDDFAKLLLNKYSIKKDGYSDFYLHKDLDDYEVKPHLDLRSKLVTYMFYLPRDEKLKEFGTNVLVPKPGIKIPNTTKHQNWEFFNIVKTVDYIPNSFFSFTPCENSYHAIKIKFSSNATKKERDTIRGFVFDKTEKDYPSYLFGNKK